MKIANKKQTGHFLEMAGPIAADTTKGILAGSAAILAAAMFPESMPYILTVAGIVGTAALDTVSEKIKDAFDHKDGFFAKVEEIYHDELKKALAKGEVGADGFSPQYEHFKRYCELCADEKLEITLADDDSVEHCFSEAKVTQIIGKNKTVGTLDSDYVTKTAAEIFAAVKERITDDAALAPTYWSIKNSKDVQELRTALEGKLDYKGSFAEYLDKAPLPEKYKNDQNRFHYLNENLKFYGRTTEIERIMTFINNTDRMKIWVICGQGGVGKNKLARYICDTYAEQYKFVWLTTSEIDRIREFNSYYYEKKVIFICDYADECEDGLKTLMDKLYNSTLENRFILLVRHEKWYNDFCSNALIREIAYNYQTDDRKFEPLNLSTLSLDNGSYKKIIENFRDSFYPTETLTEKEKQTIIDTAVSIVPSNSINQRASRCLFFLLVADSYLQTRKTAYDSNTVIQDFFTRTETHLKKKYDSSVVDAGFRLVALSTATKGIHWSNDALPEFIKNDIKIIEEHSSKVSELKNFFSHLSDTSYSGEFNHIKPYEPDILGEYLFLWQWSECLKKNLWCQYLSEQLKINEAVTIFISRTLADWGALGMEFFTHLRRIDDEI